MTGKGDSEHDDSVTIFSQSTSTSTVAYITTAADNNQHVTDSNQDAVDANRLQIDTNKAAIISATEESGDTGWNRQLRALQRLYQAFGCNPKAYEFGN